MRRGILAAVALAVLLAGCGQNRSQRATVAAYLTHVNRIERALTKPLAAVTSAGQQFASEEKSGGTLTSLLIATHEQQLAKALSQIEARRAELADSRAPMPASHLRTLLLELVEGEARLTRELAQLVQFLPRYSSALRPLTSATRRLQAALSGQAAAGTSGVTSASAARAAALRRFKQAVDGMIRQIRRLHPPEVEKPSYKTEVASLQGMSSAGGRLAAALEGGSPASVPQLLLRFQRASSLNLTVPAQKAQITAIKAYDKQIVRLSQLSQAAEHERLRLANNLS
jgi:hypothetical protein